MHDLISIYNHTFLQDCMHVLIYNPHPRAYACDLLLDL